MATGETPCGLSPDGIHCEHWYDGEPCCFCGDPEMTDEEKRLQGMID